HAGRSRLEGGGRETIRTVNGEYLFGVVRRDEPEEGWHGTVLGAVVGGGRESGRNRTMTPGIISGWAGRSKGGRVTRTRPASLTADENRVQGERRENRARPFDDGGRVGGNIVREYRGARLLDAGRRPGTVAPFARAAYSRPGRVRNRGDEDPRPV